MGVTSVVLLSGAPPASGSPIYQAKVPAAVVICGCKLLKLTVAPGHIGATVGVFKVGSGFTLYVKLRICSHPPTLLWYFT